MSLYIGVHRGTLTSLRDDDSFELTCRETPAWHLIIPGLIKMWSALEYPEEAENDVARNQDDHSYLQRTDGNLSNGEA